MKKENIEELEKEKEQATLEEQAAEPQTEEPTAEELLAQAQERIAELEDKNLRMMAEFDNYRRRTNKEKLELMETAGERIFKEMLPLVDDFERAVAATHPAEVPLFPRQERRAPHPDGGR